MSISQSTSIEVSCSHCQSSFSERFENLRVNLFFTCPVCLKVSTIEEKQLAGIQSDFSTIDALLDQAER